MSAHNKPSVSTTSTPRDVTVIHSILKDMGVTSYEPAVVNQLLDFCYRYTTDVLEDAKAFSHHANKKMIDIDDIKLAVQLKLDKSYTNPPPRELLLDIASHKNKQTLPIIKPYTGPKLPPDRYCMSAMNYQLRKSKKPHLTYTQPAVSYQRQGSQRSSLVGQPVSIVTKQVLPVSTTQSVRPVGKSIAAVRPPITSQSSVTTPTTSAPPPTLVKLEATEPIKRKLEPDDDYDT